MSWFRSRSDGPCRPAAVGHEDGIAPGVQSNLVGRRWEMSAVEPLGPRRKATEVVGGLGPGISEPSGARGAAMAHRRGVEVFYSLL